MFVDSLAIALELKLGSTTLKVAGGDVKGLRLALRPWGFEGEVRFWVSSHAQKPDAMLTPFLKEDLIEVKVSVKAGLMDLTQVTPVPIVVKGLCTEKGMVETSFPELPSNPVLLREYRIAFRDPAALIWGQHHPTALYTEATLKSVVDAALGGHIQTAHTLPAMTETRAHLFVPLGDGQASFYDYLVDIVDRVNGVFYFDYDATTPKYHFTPEKPAAATPTKHPGPSIDHAVVRFPERRRRGGRILNSYTEAAKTVPIEPQLALSGILRDTLLRTPLSADVDDRETLETARLKLPLPELEVHFKRFPVEATTPWTPTALHDEYFSKEQYAHAKKWRVAKLDLNALVPDGAGSDDVRGAEHRPYDIELVATWEQAADTVPRLPAHTAPTWPVIVEGKLVCEVGDKGDRSYQTYEDKATGLREYKVLVPLWNKFVRAPFEPLYTVGHFYAPGFKDSRVLLALYFDRSEVLRFLSWGPDVKLPEDGQGNHLLFGKKADSQTSMRHTYVDDKPVFEVQRSSGVDAGLMQIKEGIMILEIKEE